MESSFVSLIYFNNLHNCPQQQKIKETLSGNDVFIIKINYDYVMKLYFNDE